MTVHVYMSRDHSMRFVYDDVHELATVDILADGDPRVDMDNLVVVANAAGWCRGLDGHSYTYQDGAATFLRQYLTRIEDCLACEVHEPAYHPRV